MTYTTAALLGVVGALVLDLLVISVEAGGRFPAIIVVPPPSPSGATTLVGETRAGGTVAANVARPGI